MKIILFFFAFLLIDFVAAACPSGSVPSYKDKNICFIFQSNKTYFTTADENCMNLGGHLASIHSPVDNLLVTQQAANRFTNSDSSDFWIGANDLFSPGNWSSMDGTPFDYSNWEKGQPQNISGFDCGAVKFPSGSWISDDCAFKTKPYVCVIKIETPTTISSIKPKTTTTTLKPPKICPSTWTYFDYTDACYKVFENETWLNAETRCLVDQAHLASIHSLEEDLFLADLAFFADNPQCDGYFDAWVGFFTEDNNTSWKWTDGSLFDYRRWSTNQPDFPGIESCGQIALSHQCGFEKAGEFNNLNCQKIIGRFICKK